MHAKAARLSHSSKVELADEGRLCGARMLRRRVFRLQRAQGDGLDSAASKAGNWSLIRHVHES